MGIIMDMLFPRSCVGCGKGRKYLCDSCRQKVEVIGADYKNKNIEGRIGLFKYHGVIKDLIKLLKFDLVSDSAQEIGQIIAQELINNYPNIVEYWQDKKFVVIPVPLHRRRENWRGFNQANLVAKAFGGELNLEIDNKVVKRFRNTKHQAESSKVERQENIKNAFEVVGKIPKNVIIFDDVWTTGETIRNIIKVIPKNTKIWVLTLASGI